MMGLLTTLAIIFYRQSFLAMGCVAPNRPISSIQPSALQYHLLQQKPFVNYHLTHHVTRSPVRSSIHPFHPVITTIFFHASRNQCVWGLESTHIFATLPQFSLFALGLDFTPCNKTLFHDFLIWTVRSQLEGSIAMPESPHLHLADRSKSAVDAARPKLKTKKKKSGKKTSEGWVQKPTRIPPILLSCCSIRLGGLNCPILLSVGKSDSWVDFGAWRRSVPIDWQELGRRPARILI